MKPRIQIYLTLIIQYWVLFKERRDKKEILQKKELLMIVMLRSNKIIKKFNLRKKKKVNKVSMMKFQKHRRKKFWIKVRI